MKYGHFIDYVKSQFQTEKFIPLHEPRFNGNEKKYLCEAIDSTFVSSVGAFVDRFEQNVAGFVGTKYAVAVVNGTAALHIALVVAGVESGDEVITQPLTFVATCNAISYCGAQPVFVDVDQHTMGMCPLSLETFLREETEMRDGVCFNKRSNRKVTACVPMHVFGHPCDIRRIAALCKEFSISLVEDAAEGLGSRVEKKSVGTFGDSGVFSFNGNKVITAGGGGVIVTNDERTAKLAKHLTTTAKVPHAWDYEHDSIGFNCRMPNINAALVCAQLEQLNDFLVSKRKLAMAYNQFFCDIDIDFKLEPEGTTSNYWLNTIQLVDKENQVEFLKQTNEMGVMTRPVWRLMNQLSMFSDCFCMPINNAVFLSDRLVNIPSSVIIHK